MKKLLITFLIALGINVLFIIANYVFYKTTQNTSQHAKALSESCEVCPEITPSAGVQLDTAPPIDEVIKEWVDVEAI